MTIRRLIHTTLEVTMHRLPKLPARADRGQRGQIIVIAALAMIALIGGVSLVLEGGNAYAHQRIAQNAADSVANAGATVIAKRLSGGTEAPLRRSSVELRDKRVVLTIQPRYRELASGTVERRLAQLAKSLGRSPAIAIA